MTSDKASEKKTKQKPSVSVQFKFNLQNTKRA